MTVLSHQAQLRTVNPSPDNPPDHISIPENLKSRPVEPLKSKLAGGPRIPERLSHVLQYAGIRVLGDLDGKRLSDFETYRGCGQGTVWALRGMILRALHPAVKPDLRMRPIPMRDWWPPAQTIEVARAVRGLSLKDLPVSARLEGVLKGLGIRRLGQLHGLSVCDLLARPNFGRTTLAEFNTLQRRAEAGEFSLSPQELASSTPADLLRQIDEVVGRLPEHDRALLARRFGATGRAPQTVRKIGQQDGVSGAWVWFRLNRLIGWIRRQGSLKMRKRLDYVDGVCARSQVPLSPALVSTWQESARPFEHSPQFYVGIMAKLRSEAGRSTGKRSLPTQSRANRA